MLRPRGFRLCRAPSSVTYITYIHYCNVRYVLCFLGWGRKKLTETLWRCILCQYNKNLGEQLAKTICLCLQSNLISTSKEMLVKELCTLKINLFNVTKEILKEVRTAISATNGPFWADQVVWWNFARVSFFWGCFFILFMNKTHAKFEFS